jgi:3-methyladenine DNA glycosylase AlkD
MPSKDLLDPLVRLFEANAVAEDAAPMKRYMRDKFEFLGIKSPSRRLLTREYLADHKDDVCRHLRPLVRRLWTRPHREYQYTATDLLERFETTLNANDLDLLEHLITRKSWWDTVDALAAKVVGGILRRDAESRKQATERWRKSDNMWLRRTTLLFQLKYRSDTDSKLLSSVITDNLDSKEFFIQKAIGWALREYSKTNADFVRDVVESAPLSPLSEREALKWLRSRRT